MLAGVDLESGGACRMLSAHEECCRCVVARGTRELGSRIFWWHVRARAISDGFEASTKV